MDFLCGFGLGRISLVDVNAAADSSALLREFAEHRSETAFADLVHRHLDLVYSVAVRRCGGGTALAEEVCQLVFIDLARKAGRMPVDLSVAGWLHQHACFVASNQLRAEIRRRRREEIAMQLQTLADDTDWSRIAPLLDDALLELAAADRDPLVQRFFGQRSFAQIGTDLGLSENAARMRVDRALDKLGARLAKRGVTSTATALATVLAGSAVTAAPPTLAATITTAALAAAVTATSTLGLLSLMASTKMKTLLAAAALTAAGTALLLQQRSLHELRSESDRLREDLTALRSLERSEPVTAPGPQGNPAELLRLRGLVSQLQRDKDELAGQLKRHPVGGPGNLADTNETGFESAQFQELGAATPDTAAQSFMRALMEADGARFADLLDVEVTPPEGTAFDRKAEFERVAKEMKGRLLAERAQIGRLKSVQEISDRSALVRFEMDEAGKPGDFVIELRKHGDSWKVMPLGKRP